jgi:hypothetical protein
MEDAEKYYDTFDTGYGLKWQRRTVARMLELKEAFPDELGGIDDERIRAAGMWAGVGDSLRNHENYHKISAAEFSKNPDVRKKFAPDEINEIKEAILAQRASDGRRPAGKLGKLLVSAKLVTEPTDVLKRTFAMRMYKAVRDGRPIDVGEMAELSYEHLKEKYGSSGYAVEKAYYDDGKYAKFLGEMKKNLKNKEKFVQEFKEINRPRVAELRAAFNEKTA